MKKLLTALSLAAALALAGVCVTLFNQSRALRGENDRLRAELEAAVAALGDATNQMARLQRQRDESRGEAALLTAQLSRAQTAAAQARPSPPVETAAPAPSSGRENRGGLGELLARIVDNPEMREFIAEQQRGVIGAMYGPLFRQLNLNPEQTAAFEQLLANQQARGMDMAGALLGGDEEARARAIEQMAAQQREADDQIRALLGESGYASYLEYQDTMGERAAMQQFSQQMSGGGAPLTDAQSQALTRIMTEERRRATWAPGDTVYSSDPSRRALDAVMSESAGRQMLEQQRQVNQQVLDQAAGVLNAGQLEALRRFQENQLRMQRFGLEMGRRFLGRDSGDSGAPP